MQAEKVDEFLEKYHEYAARCSFLEKEIKELSRLVDELKSRIIEDNVNVTPSLTGMPRGSGISDPTGRLGTLVADSFTPDYIAAIENEISDKRREYNEKITVVIFVDSWLEVLTKRERYVIENKILCGMFWRELVRGYKEVFGEDYSKQGLKKIRDRAVEKIKRVAQ